MDRVFQHKSPLKTENCGRGQLEGDEESGGLPEQLRYGLLAARLLLCVRASFYVVLF